MDFNTALGIIRKDMEEARALLDQLSELPGTHIVEIELARSRMRSASEMLMLLPQLREEKAEVKVEDKVEVKGKVEDKVEVKVEVKEEVQVKDKVEDRVDFENEVEIIPQPQSQSQLQPQSQTQPQPPLSATASDKTEPHKATEAAKPILADKFSSTDRIGQRVTSLKQDEFITSSMLNKPINDIGAAIGINDKFYYIRELFSGDSRAFQDTIRRLNSAVSLGEAMKILDESTVMGSDPAAQSSFVDVVRRKFNINV